jgi:2-hydroxycyclohexanecarboxyl-CoA dehydrogenase
MTDTRLDGRSALIVGGSAGIGYAAAEAMLGLGLSRLTIVARNAERGEAARERLATAHRGAEIRFAACDACDAGAMQVAADEAARTMDGIDVLVSCGGGDPMPRLLKDTPIEEVGTILSMIVTGVVHPARAVLPHMSAKESGSIVCLASDAGKIATPGESVIGAAMAAIIMFCRGMSIEAKRNGIRVNCLTPSIVRDTPLYDRMMADPFAGRLFTKAEGLASLGVATPGDLAAMIAFLASPAAARVTGQAISVTGGISAA